MIEEIDERLASFLQEQPVFFVATAPLEADGHINLSPKGLDTFRVLGPREVAYLDLVGSGIETAAHLQQNGRIVLMFCAFTGPPRIVRIHGRGEVVWPDDAAFAQLRKRFPDLPGTRAIIRVACSRISQSCGMGVPRFEFVGPRSDLVAWCERKGEDGLRAYEQRHNRESIDGLPGIRRSP